MPTGFSGARARRLPRVLGAGVLAVSAVAGAPGSAQDLLREAERGGELSTSQVAVLEGQLRENPQDLGSRARLLGYYTRNLRGNPRRHAEHVLWFIRNLPGSEVLNSRFGRIHPMFNADGYLAAKRAWGRLVQQEPDNVVLLRHAAGFHGLSDRAVSIRLLQQAEALEPANPEWARRLAELRWRGARLFPEGRDPAAAAQALVDLERASERSDAAGRRELTPDLALFALAAGDREKARRYAEALLEAGANRRNPGDSIHYGNLVLGHLALNEDDLEEAGARLLAAGRTRGSPVTRLGAPDMTLAKALLERGESETVLAYLDLCWELWQGDVERLKDWIVLVEAGRIPDFGPHLAF